MKKVYFGKGKNGIHIGSNLKEKNDNLLLIKKNESSGKIGAPTNTYKEGQQVDEGVFDVVFEFTKPESCQVIIDALEKIKFSLQELDKESLVLEK